MNSKINNGFIIGSLCALGCEVMYGLSHIFTKQVTAMESTLTLLGWRFLIAFIVINICVLVGIVKINLKGKDIKPLLLVALFFPLLYFSSETMGISITTASESGVFLACVPVVSLIMSSLILRKKPTKIQVTGVLITIVGVLITVFAVGLSTSFSVKGYAFLGVAVISYALYGVFTEKFSDYTGWEITYVMLFTGAIVFVAAALMGAGLHGTMGALLSLPFRNTDFLYAIIYQGVGCSVLAFFMSNYAISKIGVNRTSTFIGVATVVSIVAGTLILNETFTSLQVVGVIVIIAGVYVANIIRKE